MENKAKFCLKWLFLFGITNLLIANTYALDCSFFESKAKDLMQKDNIVGMAITVVSPQQKLFCSYGYTNQDKNRRLEKYCLQKYRCQ